MITTEHVIPLFCPQTLVEYRSLEAPELVETFGQEHRARMEELHIERHYPSKRLTPEVLEQYWEQRSQEEAPKSPPWVLRDTSTAGCEYMLAIQYQALKNSRPPHSVSRYRRCSRHCGGVKTVPEPGLIDV